LIINKAVIKYRWQHTQKTAFLFLTPWFIGLIFFSLIPILLSLFFSFTNYDMLGFPKFTGLYNFIQIFNDKDFYESSFVTIRYVLFGVPLQLAFALFLAAILNTRLPGNTVFRAIYYVPSLLGGSVAISILWRQLFGIEGVLNQFLLSLGITKFQNMSWITHPDTAVYTIVVLLVWQFGSCMVIFVAGIQNIPQTLYEAAEIDGASRLQSFFKITFPMLTYYFF
jgi:multiple sugar transport system permease protein